MAKIPKISYQPLKSVNRHYQAVKSKFGSEIHPEFARQLNQNSDNFIKKVVRFFRALYYANKK